MTLEAGSEIIGEMEFTKIVRERAVDAVYQALLHAIVSYSLKPGERLNVEELAEKMGVSLTPVRGAIQQLATEGLVEIRPRSGTFVATLSVQDIDETFKIRCALECLAAEEAARSIRPEELERLKELLEHLPNGDDPEVHDRHNSEFHRILIRAARNRRLAEMYDALNAHIKIARIHASDHGWPQRLDTEHAEHTAIVEALEAGDIQRLTGLLRSHIDRARQVLTEALLRRERQLV